MEQKNKSNNLIIIGIVILLVIWGVSMISKRNSKLVGDSMSQTEVSPPIAMEKELSKEENSMSDAVDVVGGSVSIEAGSYYFKPNLIRVKKGEIVKITLNSVSMQHDFNIDELGVKIPLTKSGDSSTVEFTADKAGEFEFYCSVGSHRALGQVGKLIVTE